MSKLNIILNKRIVNGRPGETILQLARRLGVKIPTLCHDDRLEPFSSCYLCVVEVEGMRGLQPACSTRLVEGMRIETNNERIIRSRKMSLELMASNHYADCVAPCRETCPAGVDVQGYIAMIARDMHHEAVKIIKQTNPLPAICGRVCVRPCELACRRNLVEGVGVGIDYLKRYTADIDMDDLNRYQPELKPSSGKKVAIIGAGPGGLTAAWYLALEGHQADIFEASQHAGGMLRYGIPPYRLPNEVIEKEVEGITSLGVQIHYGKSLGDTFSYKEINNTYQATILAIGSQGGTRIGCENDDAGNIFSGIDFLRNMEASGQKPDFSGKTVAVIGGGNTAMDCCRTAMRCGAQKVIVLYRRTEKEMPANPIEIHESKLEGIEYMFLTAPARVNTHENGDVRSITCVSMELGEPDASGRRRPVKVEGSDFEVEADYVLAAIGQKTRVGFIDDISQHAGTPLKLNKWGDIEADKTHLQTTIPGVFACGDGVTGPATLIEAIAQGRRAARACHQYLSGQELAEPESEFLSRRDHFKEQQAEAYTGGYVHQAREEMPTLDPAMRKNFSEVELGYSAEMALKETMRCMECGCSELHHCDLKKYASQYGVDQKRLQGSFHERPLDLRHPLIEIDNNKCILCNRCIRICNEVVGARALGLIDRGFDARVAPAMGKALQQTNCESCGLCIDSCPTGALTEKWAFKPAPVPDKVITTICSFCSLGCTVQLHHQSGFFSRAGGSKGLVNKDGSICRFARFGYRLLNENQRITRPLLRENGEYRPIEMAEALRLIKEKTSTAEPGQIGFYAGARLSNEELYLIQKLARAGLKTNHISSFYAIGRGTGPGNPPQGIRQVPLEQLSQAGRIGFLGSEANREHALAAWYAWQRHYKHGTVIDLITTLDESQMAHKAGKTLKILSYDAFVRALIFVILDEGLENRVFIDDHCRDFTTFKSTVLSMNFDDLVKQSGCPEEQIRIFARAFNQEPHYVLVCAEEHISARTLTDLQHLCMITGKTGKMASGLIYLQRKNNAQGLHDMGICSLRAPAGFSWNRADIRKALSRQWNCSDLPAWSEGNQWNILQNGQIRQAFIFGEDPLGCANDKPAMNQVLGKLDFLLVQDAWMSETARMADLILPASLSFESGGSFTNTQRYIQSFEASLPGPYSLNSLQQMAAMLEAFGVPAAYEHPQDVMLEIASLLNLAAKEQDTPWSLDMSPGESRKGPVGFSADVMEKNFDLMWKQAFAG